MYIIFCQNFSDKNMFFRHLKKKNIYCSQDYSEHTQSCTVRKGNPFHGPFAQLSCVFYHYFIICECSHASPNKAIVMNLWLYDLNSFSRRCFNNHTFCHVNVAFLAPAIENRQGAWPLWNFWPSWCFGDLNNILKPWPIILEHLLQTEPINSSQTKLCVLFIPMKYRGKKPAS